MGSRSVVEQNKAVVRRYVERFNAGDLDGLREVFAEDAEVFGVLGWGKVADVMPIWKQLVDSLDMHLAIEGIAVDRNVVAVRYHETGTARAPFFGKPATGQSYSLVAMEWFEIQGGRIARRWGARDAASQAHQLGWDVAAIKPDVDRTVA